MKQYYFLVVAFIMLSGFVSAEHFSVNVPAVKASLEGEYVQNIPFVVTNLEEARIFELRVEGNSDVFSISEERVSLGKDESREINIIIEPDLEPGVYVGTVIVESASEVFRVPIVVDVEDTNPLFDVSTNPALLYKKLFPGEEFIVEVDVYNIGSSENSVVLENYIADLNGNVILEQHQDLIVSEETQLVQSFLIPPETDAGNYVFYSIARSGNSIGISSSLFVVSSVFATDESFISFRSPYFFYFVLFVVLAAGVLLAFNLYWYYRLNHVTSVIETKVRKARATSRRKGVSEDFKKVVHKRIRDLQSRKVLVKEAYRRGKINTKTHNQLLRKIDDAVKKLRKRL